MNRQLKAAQNMTKPNVVIITFDCLRPDRLGFAGYRGVETPTFDDLAEESLVFERAYCQAPNTWISHASMFTGCYPSRHGVRTPLDGMRSKVATMAELLSEAGYATFGLPAMNLLSPEAGFARGFDAYTLEGLEGPEGRFGFRGWRSAGKTLERCFEFLDGARTPFFLWVHYYGLHRALEGGLDLPSSYRRRFSEYAQYYDGKVSFADAEFLRPFVERLQQGGPWDNTVLVLWSDHGDRLHAVEHQGGQFAHNFDLAEEVVRTLLMIRLPGSRLSGLRGEIANSVDILPTLCDACGLEAPDGVQGRSLLSPADEPERLTAYFENLCQGCVGIVRDRSKLVLTLEEIHSSAPASQGDLARLLKRASAAARRRLGLAVKRRRKGPDAWWSAGDPARALEELLRWGTRQRTVVDLEAEGLERPHDAPLPDEDGLMALIADHGRGAGGPEAPKLDRETVAQRLKDLGYL